MDIREPCLQREKRVYIPKSIIEENPRNSHRIASAVDKKTGALGYETKATDFLILLNILPVGKLLSP